MRTNRRRGLLALFGVRGLRVVRLFMAPLPATIVDCHHHFLAPSEPFHAYINALGAPVCTEFE